MTALPDRTDSIASPIDAATVMELGFTIREATPGDNEQLIALSAACAMVGDISLRIDRGPDFFALNRLEGERWRLGVAESAGRVVGCVAVSERRAFVNGREMRTGYVGDLKVHPHYRDTRIADALSHYAELGCAELPAAAPVMITVLAGNRAMERRLSGPRGVSAFRRIATIRTHSIPILWPRNAAASDNVQIERARWSDLDQMIKLWGTVAPERQLAPVLTADRLAHWIRSAPGLDIDSYRIARSAMGELLGFLAAWDQRSFKQLTVVGYSRRMKTARTAFNTLATVIGSQRMPREGFSLNCATLTHACVPRDRPEVLRALLTSTYTDLRDTDCSIMNVGLDTRDPLSAALDGFLGQPTDVNAYVVTTRRGVLPEFLDGRPLHYEIALV
jgi:ribosomal protein S18 acetylase RimI-like enzyme